MKNKIRSFAYAVLSAVAVCSCNTLEVTLPKGPQGERGIQGTAGLTAYELWLRQIGDGTLKGWDGGTGMEDFFLYLKGKDGKSAYKLWIDYVIEGVVDPHNPDVSWDASRTTVRDFYLFLSGVDGADGAHGLDGKDGKDGEDGVSAYELWLKLIEDEGPLEDANGHEYSKENSTVRDFFIYLTGLNGKNGLNGEDGITPEFTIIDDDWYISYDDGGSWDILGRAKGDRGEAGNDGENGLSAYELWKEDVLSDEGLENPGNGIFDRKRHPKWPEDRISPADFYLYLMGKEGLKGVDGKSAYEIWKQMVLSGEGLENPDNGIYDIEEFPLWPSSSVTLMDYYLYLRGKNGGQKIEAGNDTVYLDNVDGSLYNVSPVFTLGKVSDSGTSYEYVNPFSGGAAFVVTGPGPVIIPGCEVMFTSLDGRNTYIKTSDEAGYIYLTRNELPEWYDGAPSAMATEDISSGIKPSSFSFGGRKVTDPSVIASTCKVPYRVGLKVDVVGVLVADRIASPKYIVHRIVEGVRESDPFVSCFCETSSGDALYTVSAGAYIYGCAHRVSDRFVYYRNEGAVRLFRDRIGTGSFTSDGAPVFSDDDEAILSYFGKVSNLSGNYIVNEPRGSQEYYTRVRFGNGSAPEKVEVYDTFVEKKENGRLSICRYIPDYGLKVVSTNGIDVPYIASMPEGITDGSYNWNSGHTTLTFSMNWSAIGSASVFSHHSRDSGTGDFRAAYCSLSKYGSTLSQVSFSASGNFNGSDINSSVSCKYGGTFLFTDIYDGFSCSISPIRKGSLLLMYGISGKFSYDRNQDSMDGIGTAFLFGSSVDKSGLIE